jgi:UDP-N-acetylglucosamine--N-acetylmuramyl-(pentapeptide) pyrophosphoryl-undecaprenol N-acetylglucosamine transferase
LTIEAILYLGTSGSVEQELTSRAGIPFQAVESGQLRGMAPWVFARNLLKMAQGARQAGRILADFAPDVLLVTGGFVAGPVVWAAWRAGVPILIYLPDIEPGLAIQSLSRFAAKVAVSFPEVAHHFPGKAVVTGYPVRRAFLEAAEQPGEARQQLALSENMPVLLVFGGSRGARSINQALAAVLHPLLETCQVVHVSGTLDWPQVEARARQVPAALRANYHPFPYLHEEMALALAAADLVVARAGASTLGEFPAFGLPSILVPYPHSGQHQEANADHLVSRGAAQKVPDEELPGKLLATVLDLLNDTKRLTAMSIAAKSLARPDAAARIASALMDLAQPPDPVL